MVTHEINVTGDFKAKRLRAYRAPESLKPQVEKQVQEMFAMGIIKPSKSEMASPIVCVLKGKDGKDGVRIAADYRYVNKFCLWDAYPTPDIGDIIQSGKAPYISTCDLKGVYWRHGSLLTFWRFTNRIIIIIINSRKGGSPMVNSLCVGRRFI